MKRHRAPFSLFKRNGKYLARFWSDIDQAYIATRSTGTANKTRAAQRASEMLQRGDIVPRSKDPLLLDFLRSYWENPERSVSDRYRLENTGFINFVSQWPEIKNLRLSGVDRGALYRLRDWISARKSPRMTNRIVQAVKVPISVAYDKAQIKNNPAIGIKKVEERFERRGALTVSEVRSLIGWEGEKRIHAALLLACLAGLRRGELRALKWKNVYFNSGTITIEGNYVNHDGMKEPKAGSQRMVMLHPALEEVLRDLMSTSPYPEPEDFVLPQASRGTPIGDITLRRGFIKAMQDIGISCEEQKARKLCLHGLRHTFVSHMRQHLPDFLVQAQAGHTTAKMTQETYSDRRVVDFQGYREKFAEMYNPQSKDDALEK
jgi:integrase